MKFINIGFSNLVSASRIIAVTAPDASPIRRLVQDSREHGNVIDASCGKKTESVIITDSKHVILSCLPCEEILRRLELTDENNNGEYRKNED